ncbi:hypothetical protein PQX77_008912 [Marasmius sp. AFHP31]|nr:hypothetical protein PQX77_008912 [Marasmius sp. AFHP31]
MRPRHIPTGAIEKFRCLAGQCPPPTSQLQRPSPLQAYSRNRHYPYTRSQQRIIPLQDLEQNQLPSAALPAFTSSSPTSPVSETYTTFSPPNASLKSIQVFPLLAFSASTPHQASRRQAQSQKEAVAREGVNEEGAGGTKAPFILVGYLFPLRDVGPSTSLLEGRSVKGQVRSFGLAEIAKRCGVVFEVNMTPEEFCERYREGLAEGGVMEGTEKERVQQARTAFSLESMDIVLGNQQVYLSQAAFHLLEDQLRSRDVEEQKRNRMQDAEAEAGLGPRALADPYAPYHSPGLDAAEGDDPWAAGYGDAFNASAPSSPMPRPSSVPTNTTTNTTKIARCAAKTTVAG